ncbi:MAG: phosphoribosyltransferase family protein [Bacteroidota bacterium]
MLRELIHLFYPRLCIACNGNLLRNESFLCTGCLFHLPQTHFHTLPENSLAKIFWGRLPLEQAMAFLHFKKGNAVQHILHEIKYKDNKELAVFIGTYYGSLLKKAGMNWDAVAAIPLHKSKLKKRGYNQSGLIAQGLATSLGVEDLSESLLRVKATETQTRKHRFERWENVEEVFAIKHVPSFTGKHILLVDDVITTGATLEACGKVILEIPGSKLSVASIAFANGA